MQNSEDDPDNPLLTIHLPCTVDEGLGRLYLVGGTEGIQTVNNRSTVNQLVTVQHSGLSYVLLSDINISQDVDFAASTVAINTQCKPITQACDAVAIEWTRYNCSDQFQGEFNTVEANGTSFQTSWRMNFFNDSTLETPAETTIGSFPTGQNPVYIAMAAVANGAFVAYSRIKQRTRHQLSSVTLTSYSIRKAAFHLCFSATPRSTTRNIPG